MHQWTKDGTLEAIEESEGPNDPGPRPPHHSLHPQWWIVIWVHDESTFYANDRCVRHWVHSSESAKPYVKGKGGIANGCRLCFIGLWLVARKKWISHK